MKGQLSQIDEDETEYSLETEYPWLTDEIELRSAANIRSWRAYLPDECVTTMISMGWDQNT